MRATDMKRLKHLKHSLVVEREKKRLLLAVGKSSEKLISNDELSFMLSINRLEDFQSCIKLLPYTVKMKLGYSKSNKLSFSTTNSVKAISTPMGNASR